MVMPYTAIQFTVLHKLKTFASGSSKTGILSTYRLLLIRRIYYLENVSSIGQLSGKCVSVQIMVFIVPQC